MTHGSRSLLWFSALACGLLTASCGHGLMAPMVPKVPIRLLESAPDTVKVAGARLVLSAFLWRDFMPSSPADGKPMIAVIHLVTADSTDIPADLSPTCLWVLNGRQIWASTFSAEARPPGPPYELERVARDGPKWGPNIDVDVVVGIEDQGVIRLVAARRQRVIRTE